MSQILQLGQIGQLQVQRIDDQPTVGAHDQQQRPQHHHHPVVEENQIVHDCKEQERQQPDDGEHGERPQPWHDFMLVFLQARWSRVKVCFIFVV